MAVFAFAVYRNGKLIARCVELADAAILVGRDGKAAAGSVKYRGRPVWSEHDEPVSAL
jgi:hypothetical protein